MERLVSILLYLLYPSAIFILFFGYLQFGKVYAPGFFFTGAVVVFCLTLHRVFFTERAMRFARSRERPEDKRTSFIGKYLIQFVFFGLIIMYNIRFQGAPIFWTYLILAMMIVIAVGQFFVHQKEKPRLRKSHTEILDDPLDD